MNAKLKKTGGYVLGFALLGAMIFSAYHFSSDSDHTNSANRNREMYPDNEVAKEYQPNKNDLYSLYLEKMRDTVLIDDSVAVILKVEVEKSWVPKKQK